MLTVRCYGELNDFLRPERRQRTFALPWPGRAAIKDTIEALGAPHPEVASIVVNDAPVVFSYLAQPDDVIRVYSAAAALRTGLPLLQPWPAPRFVSDVHLGRLAEHLRLLGFDTLYRNDYDDPQLAAIACSDMRILLTRDLDLLKRACVVYGYYVRATQPQQQVIEVLRRFDFFAAARPFQRCIRCNGMLEPVDKPAVVQLLPPQVRLEHERFQRCTGCGQIYWPGSHFVRLQRFVAHVLQQDPRTAAAAPYYAVC